MSKVHWGPNGLSGNFLGLSYCRRVKLWLMRVVLSVLRTVEVGLAYILMLLAMTYNGWLFLSVTIGAGTGFFIFHIVRPSTSIADDHCG